MKDKIMAWAERYEAFSLRERALILVAIIVLSFMLWDTAFMGPEEKEHRSILAQIEGIHKQTETVNTQIQNMTLAMSGGAAQHTSVRISELHSLLAKLRQQQKDLTIEFIQPEQMSKVLREMLAADGGLMLTSLESLGASPLFPPPVEKTDKNGNMKNKGARNKKAIESKDAVVQNSATQNNKVQQPEIYKHGLRIVFEGDYFNTLKYLKELEAMPWRLYWDNVEYQVVAYPKARVAITVHTLSLYKGWIGV